MFTPEATEAVRDSRVPSAGMSEKTKSDRAEVLAANKAFYAAFRAADFEAMDVLWSRNREVTVFHPNWPGISGRQDVMESWFRIMIEGSPPDIEPAAPVVILTRMTALVICDELIGDNRMIATNVFVKEDGAWRMTHHQATQLPEPASQGPESGR